MTNTTINIECTNENIKINGVAISFPVHFKTLKAIFGEPSRHEYDLNWNAVWDDIGVYASYGTWDNIININFLISKHHKLTYFPTHFFSGNILINGKTISHDNFTYIELHKNAVHKLTYEGKSKPYSISIGMNHNYKTEIPKDKYIIKQLDEEQIVFKDFGFKLSIIQELMYNKELIKPKFDLYEFVEWYDKRKIDIEEEGYEPIAEVTQYFKDLPIPKRLAKEITKINQDGGDEIYSQLLAYGDGWEDYWDIENIEDVKLFPNLKEVTLCYAKENVFEALNKIGIKTEWS